nr:DUF4055 domain-containing protein [Pseudomonas sp. NFACC25]
MDEDDKLTEIRIKESAVVADGEWGEKEVTRVRVFKRDGEVVTWSVYDGEDGSPIALEQPFALKEIPVVAVHSSPVVASGELMAAPPLIDLAYGNVQHWQEKSDQLNILRVARIPVLFASGVADDPLLPLVPSTRSRAILVLISSTSNTQALRLVLVVIRYAILRCRCNPTAWICLKTLAWLRRPRGEHSEPVRQTTGSQ